jgi:hypothetical protein
MPRLIMILLPLFLLVSVAHAEPTLELKQFVEEEMGALKTAIQRAPAEPNDEFDMQRFLLRLQAKFGIEIPFFAKFIIVPELEIVMQKETL